MSKVRLANGLEVSGTSEQVRETLNKLGYSYNGDSIYYYSNSKGTVRISSMNTTHLRNAILRIYQDWVNDLHTINNPRMLVAKIQEGIIDPTWLAMVKEYRSRPEV